MGFFGSIFGSKNNDNGKESKTIPWVALTSLEQLEEVQRKSNSKTQVIFKHSTTCGISRMVLNMFTENYDLLDEQMDFYFLDLHSYREVSNEVGYKFQILHQSPQLLIIKNETVVAHSSHGAITEIDLARYI